jgi:CubicO group peptidase (beta-lactamase class C family)
MRIFIVVAGLWLGSHFNAQSQNTPLYFPPNTGTTWATTPIENLNFCAERVDSLYQFLGDNGTKSFILLHNGRIVLERYFGTFTADSIHYWASAGKSLTAFVVGMAQEEGLIDLDAPTATYLGAGWTSCTPAQEAAITVRHQLTMTTGLEDNVPNDNCMTPACLLYKAAPGTRWAYHNAPYRLLQDVVKEASGVTMQQYTRTRLQNRIGSSGLWFNYIQYGRARDMARFGLLMHARGIWNGDTLLRDSTYFNAMINPSQPLNKSYGYLWWLNGEPSYMLPSVQFVFPGSLVPNAPADMYAALGKNDQKIHIVPSKGWVLVRQGDDAGDGSSPVPVTFDNDLWAYLNALDCTSSVQTAPSPSVEPTVRVLFSDVEMWTLVSSLPVSRIAVYDRAGRCHYDAPVDGLTTIEVPRPSRAAGVYMVSVQFADGRIRTLKVRGI